MTPQVPNRINVTDRAVLLDLGIGTLGITRKVSMTELEQQMTSNVGEGDVSVSLNADKTLFAANKKLIDCKELAAINSLDGKMTEWIKKSIRLPGPFRSGIHLIPIPAIQTVQARLEEHVARRRDLVEAFVRVYAAAREDARVRLKGLFRSNDYLSEGRVRNVFRFEWQWVNFSTPQALSEISADFFAQEQAKAAEHWKQATEEMRLVLRASMAELVDHMVDRLAPDGEGKKKVFHGTTVSKLKDFLENFSIRNITDDDQLQIIVGHAKAILEGVDPKNLRDNEAMRSNVHAGFSILKGTLDLLVKDAGSRVITFEEDEVESEAAPAA